MAIFEIHHGAAKPMKAIGVNQCKVLLFAEKYKGWHSFRNDRATRAAVERLHAKGYLDINVQTNQFKFTYPEDSLSC